MTSGILSAIAAFLIWGFLPLYLKLLGDVRATEVLGHRICWSLLFVALALTLRRKWRWFGRLRHSPRLVLISTVSALLLSLNWLTYIWAVTSGYIVEASLGYFINPLLNVLLGMVFLGERLRRFQWLALVIAAGGVVYMTIAYGRLPWIAMVLALSFACYGMIRKQSSLGSVEGLLLETVVIVLPALAYLVYLGRSGGANFGQGNLVRNLLFAGTGVVTAVPLIFFAYGAKRIPLSLLGWLQYIGPTIQMLIGIWVFDEMFAGPRVLGFSLVWLALLICGLDGIYRHGNSMRVQAKMRRQAA